MRDGWVEATLGEALEPIANRPNGRNYPLVLSVTEKRGIIPQTEVFKNRIATDDISKYKILEPMDIAYNPYLLWCGAIGQWQGAEAGVVSPVYECFRVKSNYEPRYLGYIFETGILTNYFDALAIGSIVRRRRTIPSDFTAAPVELPPLLEQKRIVDLVSSVDSYIEALRQQLERAKVSRNAVLHELLTAGGDGWVETTLGQVAVLNPAEPALTSTDHFAPMDAVHVGKRWLQYTEERGDRSGARARAGDVLFARITPCLENGKVAQVQSELDRCGGSTEFIVVRGTERCLSDFLYFWCTLKVNRDRAAELMTGTTGRQRLSWKDLGSLSLWLPPLPEQKRIVDLISSVDSYIEATERQIACTVSLRSGLLSDLLSGEHEIPASYDDLMDAA